jgi:hypothetical protein
LVAPEQNTAVKFDPNAEYSAVPSNQPQREEDRSAKNAPKKKNDPYAATAEPEGWTVVSEVPAKFNMEFVTPIPSEVNVGEIKTITWTMGKDYGVESIVTKNGQTIYPTPSPAAWTYLLIALFPVLGFFIPWCTIRAVGWAGAGFAKPVN